MDNTPEATAISRYATVKRAYDLNQERLRELETKGVTFVPSEAEIQEQVALERQRVNYEQVLQRLERELTADKARVDVEAVVETWSPTVEAKRQAYDMLVVAIMDVAAAVDRIAQVHREQEQQLARLPREVHTRLGFPDVKSLLANVASCLPADVRDVINSRPLSRGEFEAVLDVDMGLRPLAPWVIERFLKGA
jgi:ribose 1,5-bisphosphokinase PhnN